MRPHRPDVAAAAAVDALRRHDQLLALLTAGADPAAADYDSRTPLHIAASLGGFSHWLLVG
jgi:ankyrin repeat protein